MQKIENHGIYQVGAKKTRQVSICLLRCAVRFCFLLVSSLFPHQDPLFIVLMRFFFFCIGGGGLKEPRVFCFFSLFCFRLAASGRAQNLPSVSLSPHPIQSRERLEGLFFWKEKKKKKKAVKPHYLNTGEISFPHFFFFFVLALA